MTERRVPAYIVRILAYWYAPQSMQVKWGHSVSGPFGVSNGVRQGSILSLALLNLYMDDLSKQLNACNTGCMISNRKVNHLMYADDLVVFCPSSAGLQQLLNVCSVYGADDDIKLNFPVFKLSNSNLISCNRVKYLGHFLTGKNDR